jgi:hypothetical protein
VLASPVERKLVGGDGESFVRKFRRRDLSLRFDENVIDAVASLADKVLVVLRQRVEVLGTAQCQHLQLTVANELLQVSVNGSETNVGKIFANLGVNLVRGGMGGVVFNGFPDNLQLFCVSSSSVHGCECYAARSSIKDFLVSESSGTLAL